MSFGDDAAILRRFEESAAGQFLIEEGVGFKLEPRSEGPVVVVNASQEFVGMLPGCPFPVECNEKTLEV